MNDYMHLRAKAFPIFAIMSEYQPVNSVAPTPLHLLPRELLSEVANWIILAPAIRRQRTANHASGVAAIEQPPVSGVYDSYVCSRLQRMPPVYAYK